MVGLVPLASLFTIASSAATLLGGKKGGPKSPLPQVTRDAADAQTAAMDELARRRGAAADMMNGTTGYEAGAATTGRLVVGS